MAFVNAHIQPWTKLSTECKLSSRQLVGAGGSAHISNRGCQTVIEHSRGPPPAGLIRVTGTGRFRHARTTAFPTSSRVHRRRAARARRIGRPKFSTEESDDFRRNQLITVFFGQVEYLRPGHSRLRRTGGHPWKVSPPDAEVAQRLEVGAVPCAGGREPGAVLGRAELHDEARPGAACDVGSGPWMSVIPASTCAFRARCRGWPPSPPRRCAAWC
jgi:hypothetical protein